MNLTGKRSFFYKVYSPIGLVFVKLGLSPNVITFLSLVTGMLSAFFYYEHHILKGLVFLLISGLLDLEDGVVARERDKATKFGAVFDWFADKCVDGLVLGGVSITYASPFWGVLLVTASLIHSFIKPVAYAEIGYSEKTKGKIWDPLENVGFFGRPETFISLGIFTIMEVFFPGRALKLGVKIITVLTIASLLTRLIYLYKNYGGVSDE